MTLLGKPEVLPPSPLVPSVTKQSGGSKDCESDRKALSSNHRPVCCKGVIDQLPENAFPVRISSGTRLQARWVVGRGFQVGRGVELAVAAAAESYGPASDQSIEALPSYSRQRQVQSAIAESHAVGGCLLYTVYRLCRDHDRTSSDSIGNVWPQEIRWGGVGWGGVGWGGVGWGGGGAGNGVGTLDDTVHLGSEAGGRTSKSPPPPLPPHPQFSSPFTLHLPPKYHQGVTSVKHPGNRSWGLYFYTLYAL
jgi:hypothetical protein